MSKNTCVLLDGLSIMTALIVAHYSSPGPSKPQAPQQRYVNPFFCVVMLFENHPRTALKSPNPTEDHPLDYPDSARRSESPVCSWQFLAASMVLIFSIVLHAVNVPNIRKYFLKRNLCVVVSNSETTMKTKDVPVKGKIANWNENLDPL